MIAGSFRSTRASRCALRRADGCTALLTALCRLRVACCTLLIRRTAVIHVAGLAADAPIERVYAVGELSIHQF